MAVIENLDEGEAYLFAILEDLSGIDQAEFLLDSAQYDSTDGRFRAYPYQWRWWRNRDTYQIDSCARDVGKTQGIMLNALAFPFCYAGEEMTIVAPEYIHLEPVVRGIDDLMKSTRLTSEMLLKARGGGVKYKPFVMRFENGAKILGKIPQRDGKGVKGTHSTVLHFEEAQDMPKAAWTEAQAALKRGRPNAFWKAHGVTKGVQDEFWRRSQPTSEWTVHTIVAMNRLTWDAGEKAHAENEYGSQDDPDYRRNILGEHGDATSVLFVQARFMKVVDDEPESTYNTNQFATCRITDELLRERNGNIGSILQEDIPAPPSEYGTTFWMGADLGWTRDPTEVLIFAEGTLTPDQKKYRKEHLKTQPSDKTTVLTLVARVQMKRIGAVDQGYAFDWLVQHYENHGTVRALSLDATGAGEPLVDILKRHHKYTANKVKGYVFGSKVLVGYQEVDETVDVYDAQQEKDSEIWKAPDIYAIDVIRGLIDNGRMWLPTEPSIVQGFVGQTSSTIQFDQYGNRRMGKGPNGHVFDAVRMAVVGWKLATIEQLTKEAPMPPVLDVPVFEDDFFDGGADEFW